MSRFVTVKRAAAAATATAAASLALVAGSYAPAVAADQQAAATPPQLTLDFSGTNSEAGAGSVVGAGFGGRATDKDANGAVVGEAYDMCDKDAINADSLTAFCTADVVFKDGSQITLSVVFPIENPLTATYPNTFDGVVTGGTGAYKGISGAAHFTNTALAVYTVDWDV